MEIQTSPLGYTIPHHISTLLFTVLASLNAASTQRRLTVGMPNIHQKLHTRRRKRVVLGELELSGKDAAFEGRVLRALDETFPVEEVVLGDRAGGDAVGGVVGQGAVFLEEPAVGC